MKELRTQNKFLKSLVNQLRRDHPSIMATYDTGVLACETTTGAKCDTCEEYKSSTRKLYHNDHYVMDACTDCIIGEEL